MSAASALARLDALVPRYADLTDEELVERIRGDERKLFSVLMRRHNQRVFRAVRAIVSDDEEAADVVQDAWVRAYSHLEQFQGRSRFLTWLVRIAVHEALARRRRGRRFATLNGDHDEGFEHTSADSAFPSRQPSPEEALASRELGRMLGAAVESLPDSLRVVFVLRQVEELSTAETAACLGLSEANVKVRLHRAKGRLRDEIDRRLGAEARRLWPFAGRRCDRLVLAVMGRLGLIDDAS